MPPASTATGQYVHAPQNPHLGTETANLRGSNGFEGMAINDHQFLVLERNGGTGTSGTPYEKIYLIDIRGVKSGGFARKTELVGLMNYR